MSDLVLPVVEVLYALVECLQQFRKADTGICGSFRTSGLGIISRKVKRRRRACRGAIGSCSSFKDVQIGRHPNSSPE
jgi:hypothetical protein